MRIPAASARSPARRIIGPSASGSENGKPSSITSAPRLDRRLRERGRVGHRHQVDDQRLAHRASTSARSLSPRPERQTATSSAPQSSARASACERLERRNDALRLAEPVERRERLVIGARDVLGPARVAQVRVLGADARIVEARRDRMRVHDLAVLVGQKRRARAVQHARASAAEATRRLRPRRRSAARPRPGRSRRTCRSRSSLLRRRRPPPRAAVPRRRGTAHAPRRPITR